MTYENSAEDAMHANARLNAKAAGKPLFYIPAVDSPVCRMGRADCDDMRASPNISTTNMSSEEIALLREIKKSYSFS